MFKKDKVYNILFKEYCVYCKLGVQTWLEDDSTSSQKCWI